MDEERRRKLFGGESVLVKHRMPRRANGTSVGAQKLEIALLQKDYREFMAQNKRNKSDGSTGTEEGR